MARTRAPSVSGANVVADARRYLGIPYKYGGTDRRSGLDCSGLVLVVCEDLGISGCPRTSELQWAWTHHLPADQAGAGDLVFFVGAEIDPPPGHVGILVAPNTMIDAPFTGSVVSETRFSNGPGSDKIIGYGRIPGVSGSSSANASVTSGTSRKKPSSTADEVTGAVGMIVGWLVLLAGFAIIIGLLIIIFLFLKH